LLACLDGIEAGESQDQNLTVTEFEQVVVEPGAQTLYV
jgi:hypothetical protein